VAEHIFLGGSQKWRSFILPTKN